MLELSLLRREPFGVLLGAIQLRERGVELGFNFSLLGVRVL